MTGIIGNSVQGIKGVTGVFVTGQTVTYDNLSTYLTWTSGVLQGATGVGITPA